jgi:hypothetical protein
LSLGDLENYSERTSWTSPRDGSTPQGPSQGLFDIPKIGVSHPPSTPKKRKKTKKKHSNRSRGGSSVAGIDFPITSKQSGPCTSEFRGSQEKTGANGFDVHTRRVPTGTDSEGTDNSSQHKSENKRLAFAMWQQLQNLGFERSAETLGEELADMYGSTAGQIVMGKLVL